jgi:hypothetical protein
MSADHPSSPAPAADLPPVTPPSGRFILQLFVVPGAIVALVVCLLLVAHWLFGGPSSPEAFLKKLDDRNAEVRWRGAADLAQVLLRNEQLARNADFALQLTQRLERAVRENDVAEKASLEKTARLSLPDAVEAERRRIEPERNYIFFLSGALGSFRVPMAVAVLNDLAQREPPMEITALAARRRRATWALANLGQNLRRFDQTPTLEQDLVLAQLRTLQDSTQGEALQWVKTSLEYLEKHRAGQPSALGVDRALARAAAADDPVLRYEAAFALTFWQGDAAENKLIEDTLVRLAHDNGRGEDRVEEFSGPDPDQKNKALEIVDKPGLFVRVNATLALLRRGSDKTPGGQVEEMLDEKALSEAIQTQHAGGAREPNQGKAIKIVVETLHALADGYRQNPKLNLPGIWARVEELTHSSNAAIQAAARHASKARTAKPQAA